MKWIMTAKTSISANRYGSHPSPDHIVCADVLTSRDRRDSLERRAGGRMPERITEMTPSNGPGPLSGAVVGAMFMASLIAAFYLGWRLVGLPFVAFDVFDWMARTLPGSIIAFGIDAMVGVIRALHLGPTSAVAKTAEQTMAIAGLLVTGAIAGAALFALLRVLRRNHASLFG